MRFSINTDVNELPDFVSGRNNPCISIEKGSLIYMEVKTSFPLKNEMENGKKKVKGEEETIALIKSIFRKCKKFLEIAKIKVGEINKIHILFMYDTFLQNE